VFYFFYKNKGFEEKDGYFIIPIKDLPKNSNKKVKVKCDICGKEKEIKYQKYNKNISNDGYYACSNLCSSEKRKKTCLEKYGVDNPFKSEKIKEKIKVINFKKYGVEHFFQSEICKELLDNYLKEKGGEKIINAFQLEEIKEKIKKTCLKKYGNEIYVKSEDFYNKKNKYLIEQSVENAFQIEEVKEKIKKTNLKKYGFDHHFKNKEFFENYLKNLNFSYKLKKHKSGIFYQSSYEKDFLNKYSNKIKITRNLKIEYNFDGKIRTYYPDFYLPDYNLIVEIKSDYIFELQKEKNIRKKESSIKEGYDFIFIINKDYKDFNKIIQ